MISSVGIVPPLILPIPGEYDSLRTEVVVTAATDPDAVDVAARPGNVFQTPPDDPPSTLDTIITPEAATVSYLPAGQLLVQDGWPQVVGPFDQDAWVVSALHGKSPLADMLPPGSPVPVYWVLEGVDRRSVDDPDSVDPDNDGGLLNRWHNGEVPGVKPRADECHRRTDPDQRADIALHTWKQRMMAGTWAESVPAETALGLATADGDWSRLRVWTFGADGTPLPAAASLAALAIADPDLLPAHPVVAGCGVLTDNVPVRFYLRFEVWDVDQSSASDPKGAPRSLQPDTVRLIDSLLGSEITGTQWTWREAATGGVLEVPRPSVRTATFHIRAEFPAGQQIRLSRTEKRVYPPGQRLVWNSAGWTARDSITPGSWTGLEALQLGTLSQPVAYWIGTKVRLAAAYQQPRVDWFKRTTNLTSGATYTISRTDTYPVAAGHRLDLYQTAANPVAYFVTDDDGEVSGVVFDDVVPGTAVRLGLALIVGLPSVGGGSTGTLFALSDGSNVPSPVFAAGDFLASNARVPLLFVGFNSGVVGAAEGPATFVVDADRNNFATGNTAYAAALHALKCAKLTHDAVVLLKGDSVNLPQRHDFQLALTSSTAVTVALAADAKRPDRTETTLPSNSSWFCSNVVPHEYGHAIVNWLGSALPSPGTLNATYAAIAVTNTIQGSPPTWPGHTAGAVINSGVALDEGLAEFVECLMGYVKIYRRGHTSLKKHGSVGHPAAIYLALLSPTSSPQSLSRFTPAQVRAVEGAVALAQATYLLDTTKFPGFGIDTGPTSGRFRPAQAYLDDWLRNKHRDLGQLQRMFRWLFTDAVSAYYGNPSNWLLSGPTGWPAPQLQTATYPSVEGYLTQLTTSDPAAGGSPPTPEESYQHFNDRYLVPWNLEP
ncbi:hypothetical protein ACPPVO_24835 [Dactylosporangium sp. McL0621]|uniref:hypothetical protein n=1 Tax=Dactylosporangium sp. McL0621 TaxID=3415678 RepID=UPI003CF9DCA5